MAGSREERKRTVIDDLLKDENDPNPERAEFNRRWNEQVHKQHGVHRNFADPFGGMGAAETEDEAYREILEEQERRALLYGDESGRGVQFFVKSDEEIAEEVYQDYQDRLSKMRGSGKESPKKLARIKKAVAEKFDYDVDEIDDIINEKNEARAAASIADEELIEPEIRTRIEDFTSEDYSEARARGDLVPTKPYDHGEAVSKSAAETADTEPPKSRLRGTLPKEIAEREARDAAEAAAEAAGGEPVSRLRGTLPKAVAELEAREAAERAARPTGGPLKVGEVIDLPTVHSAKATGEKLETTARVADAVSSDGGAARIASEAAEVVADAAGVTAVTVRSGSRAAASAPVSASVARAVTKRSRRGYSVRCCCSRASFGPKHDKQ